ncbi:hypothetical protein [Rubellimicrobium roseum]|uniref:Uncharacterized protein n=1 Tax=Rubellimicrobium roseum TaxID=687525 RepID=A0A5C4N7W5_9RHOB|nr:hypothetical protein [Rubellimicrobium roseum]TNC63992.1 hypothetical protein FHG71_18820 [Rubellimicrobium roseum]
MSETFTREVQLCSTFMASLPEEWVPYAETGGFDILLVRRLDGFQIGVQAKLRLNAKVIRQACETGGPGDLTAPGPDCRAILVPQGAVGDDMAEICRMLGLTVMALTPGQRAAFTPDLPRPKQDGAGTVWFEMGPARRLELPDHVPDVEAGVPAPLRLTAWKIKAIRIAVTLERRGVVLRDDFKHHKIDMRRWIAPRIGWLIRQEPGWARGPRLPDFRAQHPRNWAQIEAAYETWRRPDPREGTVAKSAG